MKKQVTQIIVYTIFAAVGFGLGVQLNIYDQPKTKIVKKYIPVTDKVVYYHQPLDAFHTPSLYTEPAPRPRKDKAEQLLKCLKLATRELFDKVEKLFGEMEVISVCNHSWNVAGTNTMSRHVIGMAVDFIAGSRKQAVVNWLVANHKSGGTMTYGNSSHIHVDVGPHFVSLAESGGGSRRRYSRDSDDD